MYDPPSILQDAPTPFPSYSDQRQPTEAPEKTSQLSTPVPSSGYNSDTHLQPQSTQTLLSRHQPSPNREEKVDPSLMDTSGVTSVDPVGGGSAGGGSSSSGSTGDFGPSSNSSLNLMFQKSDRGPPPLLTIQNFLLKNDVSGLKEKRDSAMGWQKYIYAALAIYFFITPLLPILTSFGSRAWLLAIMWSPVAIIVVGYFEYYARAELWHILICKGIIVNFSKKEWFARFLFYVNLALIGLVAVMVFVMDQESSSYEKRVTRAILMIFAMSFTISVVRGITELEEANRIHTVNVFLDALGKNVLEHHGFKVIHYTQLAVWAHKKHFERLHFSEVTFNLVHSGRPPPFSWNELYRLTSEKDREGFHALPWRTRLFWGSVTYKSIQQYKNMDQ